MAVSRPVFISYARFTHAEEARRLHDALVGVGVPVFLDEADLDAGDQLPAGIVDGLFGAGVVVCFCDEAYFSRYCLREFHVALGAFNALVRDGGSEGDKDEALLPVAIALHGLDGLCTPEMGCYGRGDEDRKQLRRHPHHQGVRSSGC